MGAHAAPLYATHDGYPVRDGIVYPPKGKGFPYPAPKYSDASHDPSQGGVLYCAAERKFHKAEAESKLYDPTTTDTVEVQQCEPESSDESHCSSWICNVTVKSHNESHCSSVESRAFRPRPEAMPMTAEMVEKAKQIEAKQAADRIDALKHDVEWSNLQKQLRN
jgi:hypothetical protein